MSVFSVCYMTKSNCPSFKTHIHNLFGDFQQHIWNYIINCTRQQKNIRLSKQIKRPGLRFWWRFQDGRCDMSSLNRWWPLKRRDSSACRVPASASLDVSICGWWQSAEPSCRADREMDEPDRFFHLINHRPSCLESPSCLTFSSLCPANGSDLIKRKELGPKPWIWFIMRLCSCWGTLKRLLSGFPNTQWIVCCWFIMAIFNLSIQKSRNKPKPNAGKTKKKLQKPRADEFIVSKLP